MTGALRHPRPAAILTALTALMLASCSDENERADATDNEWERVVETSLTRDQQAQLQQAEQARNEMFSTLSAELSSALSEGRPPSAVSVCSEIAPSISERIGDARGLRIGRTSFKLRNPANTPPGWARNTVEQRVDQPVYFEHDDGRFAALTPIRLAPNCLVCHGEKSQLAPGVADALERHYPKDQATGFEAGDLRGWFWVEVPTSAATTDG